MAQIADERFVLKALREEGWKGEVETLHELARLGDRLRQRYENECSYPWAANSDTYRANTRKAEEQIARICKLNGLTLYLQTDCRGATVYVRDASERIDDNAYSTQGHALFYAKGE
jgi:hypothetical protein